MQMVFAHGADGYEEDGPMARELATMLGARLVFPSLVEEDTTLDAGTGPVREALESAGDGCIAIGHSFGASILLHAVAASRVMPRAILLLAMPDWGADGWDVDAYLPPSAANDLRLPVTLHHCRDDDVVPFSHLAANAHALPRAAARSHPHGGHAFSGALPAVLASSAGIARTV